VHQDYRILGLDQIEAIEKSTLRVVVQAIQEYSWEAKQIFDKTEAASDTEVIVLAEDIVQYALEVAEFYPINKRYAGFIDYKRVRWFPAAFGVFPQALLVDAKASTENTRDTLQQSQLPMDAEFLGRDGKTVRLRAGVEPHLEIAFEDGATVAAISTSILVHFYYDNRPSSGGQQRDLRSIFVLSLPHASLKQKYNPDPQTTFFGQGKHSPARGEVPRVRVYFSRLKSACPWRLQELKYDPSGGGYTTPRWRDGDGADSESSSLFHFIPRGSR
jgi:hypothetical protein